MARKCFTRGELAFLATLRHVVIKDVDDRSQRVVEIDVLAAQREQLGASQPQAQHQPDRRQAPRLVVRRGREQGLLFRREKRDRRAEGDGVRIVPLGGIGAQHAGVVDQIPEKASGRGQSALARGPAIGVAQEPRDVRLVDRADRLWADQLLQHDEIVAIGLDRVGRPTRLLQLPPIPGTCQIEAAFRRQRRQAAQDRAERASGAGSEERKLIGRFGRKSLLPRQKRGILGVGALPFGGGQTIDRASGARRWCWF